MTQINLALFILTILAAAILVPGLGAGAPADDNIKVFKGEDVYIISELGVTLVQEGDSIKVDLLLPSDARDEKYKGINIKAGDYVIMMNGKKIKSISEMEGGYEIAADGDVIKLGLKRDNDLFIVSFDKDSESNEGRHMMIYRQESEGDSSGGSEPGKGSSDIIILSNNKEKTVLVPQFNLLLNEKEDGLYVGDIISAFKKFAEAPSLGLQKGDRLIKLQGTEIKDIDQFSKIFDKIKSGEQIDLLFDRQGQQLEISAPKSESAGIDKILKVKQVEE